MHRNCIVAVGLSVAALSLTAAFKPSYAASFDCAKATSIVETLICRDPALSQLDDRLSAAYSAARTRSGNAPQLSGEQPAWTVQRNQCQTTACVSGAYSARLVELEAGIKYSAQLAESDASFKVAENPDFILGKWKLGNLIYGCHGEGCDPERVIWSQKLTNSIQEIARAGASGPLLNCATQPIIRTKLYNETGLEALRSSPDLSGPLTAYELINGNIHSSMRIYRVSCDAQQRDFYSMIDGNNEKGIFASLEGMSDWIEAVEIQRPSDNQVSPTISNPAFTSVPSAARLASGHNDITMCDRLAGSVDTYDGYKILGAAGYDVMHGKGGATYQSLNPARSIPACREALARDPNNGRLWFELGRSLEKANQLRDAIAAYNKSADLGSADGLNNLGELYGSGKGVSKDEVLAVEFFERAMDIASAEATANFADIALRKYGPAAYDEITTRIEELNSGDPDIGPEINRRLSKIQERIRSAQRANGRDPDVMVLKIQFELTPSKVDGRFCVGQGPAETCLPRERLSYKIDRVTFERNAPLSMAEYTGKLDTDASLYMSYVDKPLLSLNFLSSVSITYMNAPDQTQNSSMSSQRGDLTVGLRHLRLSEVNDARTSACWRTDRGRLCAQALSK